MLIDLYILGDSLEDIALRNRRMKILVTSEVRWVQDEDRVTYIWNNTPSNSPLRKIIVDRYAMLWKRKLLAETFHQYPTEMVQEVLLLILPTGKRGTLAGLKTKLLSYVETSPGDG